MDLVQKLHDLADAKAESSSQEGTLLRERHGPRISLALFRDGANRLELTNRVLQNLGRSQRQRESSGE